MDALSGIVREALVATAVLCLPVLAVATGIGTVVAVLQAATQIQEQTLTLLPKLIAVAIVLAICGRFGLGVCASLFTHAIDVLPQIAHGA